MAAAPSREVLWLEKDTIACLRCKSYAADPSIALPVRARLPVHDRAQENASSRCEGPEAPVPEKPQDGQVAFSAGNFPIPYETRLSKLFRQPLRSRKVKLRLGER
jgi:hypothetical protein